MTSLNKLKILFPILSITALCLLYSCGDDTITPETPVGKLKFEFVHLVDNSELVFDSLLYYNEAGNNYLINEIQYFISDIRITGEDGSSMDLNEWNDIYYVDTDLQSSQELKFKEDITIGTYSMISFTMGLIDSQNESLMFVNPPQSFMFWPENLGGGYHYLKLNGKWINDDNLLAPYNFHLGRGQIYHSYPDSITGFIDNSFRVEMQNSEYNIDTDQTTTIIINMNVDRWFSNPNKYDHNHWGGDIMQNQDAMNEAAENGHDVFTYTVKK